MIDSFDGFPEAGSVIALADSDCISNSNNKVLACYNLFEEAVLVATEEAWKKSKQELDFRNLASSSNSAIVLDGERLELGFKKLNNDVLSDTLE